MNDAFASCPQGERWIEIFYSRPSWSRCLISYSADKKPWKPFGKFQLIDASHIRPGFRVFRIQADRFEFKLADGLQSNIEDNDGKNFIIEGSGRYVLESGKLRWVSDADILECLKPLRPRDQYIELYFQPPTKWEKCLCVYAKDGGEWGEKPGEPLEKSALGEDEWSTRVKAKTLECAFNDGGEKWDSNVDQNYKILMPGKWLVGCAKITYLGPPEMDLHSSSVPNGYT